MRRSGRPIRVLHCPTTVGGNPQALARAERGLGLDSVAVAFEQDYIAYATDEVLFLPGEPEWKRELKRWRMLWRAARGFDVVHYNFGKTILPARTPFAPPAGAKYPRFVYQSYDAYRRVLDMRELAWLKRAGKALVVTFQGDDARQGEFTLANFDISMAREVEPGYYTPESDAQKRRMIRAFDRYADRIYALNPDLLHVLPERAEFLPYANVDLREWSPPAGVAGGRGGGRPVVLHAPTHRGAKGTRHVVEAVRDLREGEGLDFEFVLVEGLSHAEARRLYERADLLVDQLLSGWYGGLAVELMALGKPVVCYLREQDLKFIPARMRQELPVINADPSSVRDVLREWLTSRRESLPEVGRRSRAYVEHWHDPPKVAAKLKADYEEILSARRRPG